MLRSFVARLRRRQLVQWALAYLAGAWLLLQIADVLAQPFAWPDHVVRALTAALAIGFFAALIIAWYHGDKGAQRVSAVELLMLTGILLIAGAAVAFVGGRERERSSGAAPTGGASNGSGSQLSSGLVTLANVVQVTTFTGVEARPRWSPNGRALVFQSDRTGDWDVWVTQLGSGQAVNRTPGSHAHADHFPTWSPDGQWIAFFSSREGRGYFLMPSGGGVARKVAPYPGNEIYPTPPEWSPAGDRLAYAREQRSEPSLEILTIATGVTRRLPLPPRPRGTAVADMSWSPDGRWLAYRRALSPAAATAELWLTPLAGGESTQLTGGSHRDVSPSWSPDSRTLYFVSDRGGIMDLWALALTPDGRPDGSPRQITAGIEMLFATVSPDGRKVAYTKGRTIRNVFRAPLLANRPATWQDVTQLTFDDAEYESIDVAQDGRLLLSSDRSGNWDIHVLTPDGVLQQLTTDLALDAGPRWNRTGTEAVFYSSRTGHREVWIKPMDGGRERQVTRGQIEKLYPTWSPSGREIAAQTEFGVIVTDVRTGMDRRLTQHPHDGSPAWSPDARWVAIDAYREEEFSVWRVPASGGAPELLTGRGASVPRWSPDGSQLYFLRQERMEGDFPYQPDNVWVLSLGSREEKPVTDLGGRRGSLGYFTLAVDDRFVYFTWEESRADIWIGDLPAQP